MNVHISQIESFVDAEIASKGLSSGTARLSGLSCQFAEAFKLIVFGIPPSVQEFLASRIDLAAASGL